MGVERVNTDKSCKQSEGVDHIVCQHPSTTLAIANPEERGVDWKAELWCVIT